MDEQVVRFVPRPLEKGVPLGFGGSGLEQEGFAERVMAGDQELVPLSLLFNLCCLCWHGLSVLSGVLP